MCRDIKAGRDIGRRQSVVIVAEGAQDRSGNPITADQIKTLLEDELGEDTRITILGHVQRGGAPSAFDRYLAHPARRMPPSNDCSPTTRTAPPQLIGLRGQPGGHLAADGLCRADPGGRRADQGAGLRRGNAVARR